MDDHHSESEVEVISFPSPDCTVKCTEVLSATVLGQHTTNTPPNKPKTWAFVHVMVANKKKVLVDAEYNAIALSRRYNRGTAMGTQ
jgi:hypothetical protein